MESLRLIFIISVVFLLAICCAAQKDPTNLLDKCMDGMNHKDNSGPESIPDTSVCSSFAKKSCCNATVAEKIDGMKAGDIHLGFTWDVCDGKPLSDKCRQFFKYDLCFYECSPNLGPWFVPDRRKIRQERYIGVPICATDCKNWFDACKDDFTCTDNWSQNFIFKNGKNQCPPGATCRTFKEIFQTERDFCETIFHGSLKYTYDTQPCMRMLFNNTLGNPNDRIAMWELERQRKRTNGQRPSRYVSPVLFYFAAAFFAFVI